MISTPSMGVLRSRLKSSAIFFSFPSAVLPDCTVTVTAQWHHVILDTSKFKRSCSYTCTYFLIRLAATYAIQVCTLAALCSSWCMDVSCRETQKSLKVLVSRFSCTLRTDRKTTWHGLDLMFPAVSQSKIISENASATGFGVKFLLSVQSISANQHSQTVDI